MTMPIGLKILICHIEAQREWLSSCVEAIGVCAVDGAAKYSTFVTNLLLLSSYYTGMDGILIDGQVDLYSGHVTQHVLLITFTNRYSWYDIQTL